MAIPVLLAADEPPNLTGHWAQKIVLTSVTDLPLIGDVTSKTTSYRQVEITQDGRQISWQPTTCDVTIDSNTDAAETILPDAFVEAIPDPRRTGQILTSSETDTEDPRLEIEPALTVMGANLRDPANESLPDSPDAPPVTDDDNDGHPGVTVRIDGILDGRLFIVRRSVDSYSAIVEGTDRLRGLVDWTTQQSVLKSTNPLLANAPDPKSHPDPERSWFAMTRLDQDLDCSELLSRRKELFGEGP